MLVLRSQGVFKINVRQREMKDANMTKSLLSKAMTSLPLLLLGSMLYAQAGDATTSNSATDPGVSKVRIVRLSQVRGAVQIDRSNGRGFEPGIANLPIIEHNQLRTGVGIAPIYPRAAHERADCAEFARGVPNAGARCERRHELRGSYHQRERLYQPGEIAGRKIAGEQVCCCFRRTQA